MADRARRRTALRAVIVFAIVVAVDQLTKHTLGTWIEPGQVRHVIPGVTLVYERNTGVAFSFLAGTGALVYVVTAVALIGLVGFMLLRPGRRLLWLPTGILVGGAVGNLIDRVARGSVIDFIKLPHWPAFNFADMSITFGVIILVFVVESGSQDA
ncbi:MAG TPA: signal peptidase II [Solirubrobacteraceae bacterium]|jgi:signal peptidase II|nr:signal peptidase II [Solirubrobacteraceae bacterium]